MEKHQILAIYGTDYTDMTVRLLEAADFEGLVPDRHARIGIKPNLVVAATADGGAVTHPEIIEGVIRFLQGRGYDNFCVLEGSWVGDRTKRAYEVSGIGPVCREYGVEYIDLQTDSAVRVDARGLRVDVCSKALELDFLINLPVLKGHCQTVVTCALKNHKGLLPNREKRRFHAEGLHSPIAHLAAVFSNELIIVDNICGDLDFEEGGNPVTMNRILCARDPVLVDAFACRTLGYDMDEVTYISLAEKLGVGSANVENAELIDLNKGTFAAPTRTTRRVKRLAEYVAADNACSACYGMLIHALDKLERRDELWGHQEKFCIGQGYRKKGGAIGVGRCTEGCVVSCKGCPPTAADILTFLENNWK